MLPNTLSKPSSDYLGFTGTLIVLTFLVGNDLTALCCFVSAAVRDCFSRFLAYLFIENLMN